MKRTAGVRILYYMLVAAYGLFCSIEVYGQDSGAASPGLDTSIIKWVGQYPPTPGSQKQPFFKKLDEIVFGARQPGISAPVCALTDDAGNFWILSQGNGRILHLLMEKGYYTEKSRRKEQSFPSLVSACIVPGRGVYFTDSFLDKIFFTAAEAKEIHEFQLEDSLQQPTGLAWSEKHEQLWIVETGAHQLAVYNIEGQRIRTIGSRGTGDGEFNFPTHIWIDAEEIVYVVDAMNFRIQLFSTDGKYLSSFGQQGNVSGSFSRPKGLATDSYGNIYVVDALFNTVQIFNRKGQLLYYFGKKGSKEAEFWLPSGIFIDQKDYIYVSDSYNNRVQVFQLARGGEQ